MNMKRLNLYIACALSAGLLAIAPEAALAHKGGPGGKRGPKVVMVQPGHHHHHHRHGPPVVYVVPARPHRDYHEHTYGYGYPYYGNTLDLGLHTGPYGTYLDVGAGIRLD